MSEPSTATATLAAPATYQDVLDAPAHVVAELIGGTLHTHPRRAPRHARAGARLISKLGPPFDEGDGGPGGWRIFYEPELHLDDKVLVPDLAGWRRERMPELPESAYFTLAPDWVCEILSASTRAHDLVHKRPRYAAAGIAHLWLVEAETWPTGISQAGAAQARRRQPRAMERQWTAGKRKRPGVDGACTTGAPRSGWWDTRAPTPQSQYS